MTQITLSTAYEDATEEAQKILGNYQPDTLIDGNTLLIADNVSTEQVPQIRTAVAAWNQDHRHGITMVTSDDRPRPTAEDQTDLAI